MYRGKDEKCSFVGLEKDTEYNVRVRCIVGELRGEWSDNAGFRTKNLTTDSDILSKEENGYVF